MAQILEDTTVQLQRGDMLTRARLRHPVTPAPRSSGIHVSGVLRYLVLESGLIRYQDQLDDDELPLRMACGFMWEEFCASLYPSIIWQPGEISESGLLMNCDGLSATELAPSGIRVEEFKATWRKAKSAADVLSDEWYWMQQTRAYCWAYHTNDLRLHALFINGDYRGSGPLYRRYAYRFEDREIETTKNMLLANCERAIEKGYAEAHSTTQSQPPPTSHPASAETPPAQHPPRRPNTASNPTTNPTGPKRP